MQRLFEIVTMKEEKETIYLYIKDSIEDMAFHPKGNYVLNLGFQVLEDSAIEHIIVVLIPHFLSMTFEQ